MRDIGPGTEKRLREIKHIKTKWFEQGIFWNNFPVGEEEYLKQFKEQVEKTPLSEVITPYVIFTGTTHINFGFITENAELANALKAVGLDIYLYEPLSLYVEDEDIHSHLYYSEFHNKHNYKTRASELDCVERLVEETGIPVTVHSCDYTPDSFLQSKYPTMKIVCNDFFLKASMISEMTSERANVKKNIQYPFWCGNGRYTTHRHLIMTHMVNYPGVYSWHYLCRDFDSAFREIEWTQELPLEKMKKGNKRLNKANLYIDGKSNKKPVDDARKFFLAKKDFSATARFRESYNACFCAVVNETRFAQPTANFSEKVLTAVTSKTPFVLVAPPRTLEYARKLGFKTFSDFWDESYDLEENHSKRMIMIFDVIDSISKMSTEEMEEMYSGMQEILNHNFEVACRLNHSTVIFTS